MTVKHQRRRGKLSTKCFVGLSFAFLFLQVKSYNVKLIRIEKGVAKSMFKNMTNGVGYATKKALFFTFHVDILCTKRVENVVEI